MLGSFHLPSVPGRDVQIFTKTSLASNAEWSIWTKPRGLSMAWIFVLAGGGGGGKGLAGVAGGARGGGGGGGGSGQSVVLVPLELLPDQLFFIVGNGGIGASDPATASGAGIATTLGIYPDTTATNVLVTANPGAGGANGTGAGNAAGGTAGGLVAIASMPLGGLGEFSLIAGLAGSTGGSPTTAGTALALPTTSILCMGGTGGGGVTSGTNFAGGAITAITNSLLSQSAPTAAAAGPGNHGSTAMLWKPFFSFSGMGGGSSDSVIPSGDGGAGSYGSGGGGGGGGIGNAAAQNSPGGRGGSGLIIISCW